MGRFKELLDPRFYLFLCFRLRAFCRRIVSDFNNALGVPGGLRSHHQYSITDERYLNRDATSYIGDGVQFRTPKGPPEPGAGIHIGRHAWIAGQTTFSVFSGTNIRVGDHCSIQSNCWILGDVAIGRYCLLAPDVFISSGNHNFKLRPSWLIKDQDRLFSGGGGPTEAFSAPVTIEDDCWLGKNVVVSRGIYIGKGSVIGANCVVTRDVAPYSVHAGAPNRELSKRLSFSPPLRIDSAIEMHSPYFYSGFDLMQEDLAKSGSREGIHADGDFCVVMAGGRFAALRIEGTFLSEASELNYIVQCNGVTIGPIRVEEQSFSMRLSIEDQHWDQFDPDRVSEVLRDFNVFTFKRSADDLDSIESEQRNKRGLRIRTCTLETTNEQHKK